MIRARWSRARHRERSTDEAELIEEARRGDVEAYGELVRRYQHDARRTAAAIGGVAVADDAAQEGLVRAFTFLHRYRPGAPFRPWLLAVVANAARNQRRSAGRWERAARAPSERGVDPGHAPSAEEVVIAASRVSALREALKRLPARDREVVSCRYFLDLNEGETAQVLGISRGTVKSRLSRALDRLERTLPKEAHRA